MTIKIRIDDFISNTCRATNELDAFLDNWLTTEGNPCCICRTDKSVCCHYQSLVARGVVELGLS